jgi:large subunit ribosomal protein L10
MPSLINELMLKELTGVAGTAPSLILVDYSKLNAEDTIKLRSDLRKAGATLKVSKVRLLRRSIPASASKIIEKSKGSVGVILATDMVSAAKIVADLAKEDKVSLRGGLMDGAALDTAAVKKIASLPSKQTLRAMLVNVLAAPIIGFARVIDEINKKQGGGSAAAAPADAAPADAAAAPSA